MRIAQIAPIAERVPPVKYGGTERVIYTLTEELVKRGHEVTLFASGDSITSARLISVFPKSLREAKVKDLYGFNIPTMMNMGLAYSMQDEFDIIHDHNPHVDLPAANIARTPVVMTWHGPYDEHITRYFKMLNRTHVVSISKSQARGAGNLKFAGNVYNGLYMEHYPFSPVPGKYLIYVGRIDREKGTHIAIDVAAKLNMPLIIAAKYDADVPHIKEYYETEVAPRLKRHAKLVQWVGEVDETRRNDLMKDALCLIHPVTWPEPFGLTMIESMTCGTPVVAMGLGSIPEVVEHGRTGYVARNFDELLEGVRRAHTYDRGYCRQYVLARFSGSAMATGYEQVYEQVLQSRQKITKPKEVSAWQTQIPQTSSFGNWLLKPSNS